MRGVLQIDGWYWQKNVRLGKGLLSSVYRHRRTNWTAQETFRGPLNTRLGLLIKDDKGVTQGLVKDVSQLP